MYEVEDIEQENFRLGAAQSVNYEEARQQQEEYMRREAENAERLRDERCKMAALEAALRFIRDSSVEDAVAAASVFYSFLKGNP